MGWLGAPTGPGYKDVDCSHWQLFATYNPPLVRSATVSGYVLLVTLHQPASLSMQMRILGFF